MTTLLNRETKQAPGGMAIPAAATSPQAIGRTACVLIGGIMLTEGLRRRSVVGSLVALSGAELIRQGALGRGAVLRAMGVSSEEAVPEVVELTRTLTILRSPDELHALWRDPATLPQLLQPMAQVTVHEDAEADWVVTGPLGLRLHWRTRVLEDRPGEFIAWSAQPGALLPHAVEIRFRPLARERGTEVELRLRLMPPGGLLGTMAASRLKDIPAAMAQKTLRRFKSLAETGEIPTHRHAPACREAGRDD